MRKWKSDLSNGTNAEYMVMRWTGAVNGHNDLLLNMEVKNSWHGGDVVIEEDSVLEQGIKGWIYTTKAHCVIFVDYQNEQAVLIEMDELRKKYNQMKERFELVTQETDRNNQLWHSTHRKIPIQIFERLHLRLVNGINN